MTDIVTRLRAIVEAPFSVPLHFRDAARDAIQEMSRIEHLGRELAAAAALNRSLVAGHAELTDKLRAQLANAPAPERTKVVSQASGQDRVEPSNPSDFAAGGEP